MSSARATSADDHWRVRLLELAQDWRFAVLFLFTFSVLIRFIEIAISGWYPYLPNYSDGGGRSGPSKSSRANSLHGRSAARDRHQERHLQSRDGLAAT
jgi:hypothetical protein